LSRSHLNINSTTDTPKQTTLPLLCTMYRNSQAAPFPLTNDTHTHTHTHTHILPHTVCLRSVAWSWHGLRYDSWWRAMRGDGVSCAALRNSSVRRGGSI